MSGQQSSPTRRHRLSAVVRARAAVAVLLIGCASIVGLAVTSQAPASPGLQFIQVGHWVFNSASESAVHVDGSTNQVDARARIPGGAPGSRVTQDGRSGYVVERSRITVFSKSTLSVENASTPPATELPVVLEVAGGPYLVYRNAGQVVRLGNPTATIPAGGPLSDPVTTSDGSVWLHRKDTGSLCELPREATRMTCPAQLEAGHEGALTVVEDRPVAIDTTSDTLRVFGKEGFSESTPIGFDLPATAKVASSTVAGRLAAVDPGRNQLHLIDSAGLFKRPATKPVAVDLPKDAKFTEPVAGGNFVAVVDQTRNELLTYDGTGKLLHNTKIPGQGGAPKLAKGEDNRIYVDSADGSHVLVVNGDNGTVAGVDTGNGGGPGVAAGPNGNGAATLPVELPLPPAPTTSTNPPAVPPPPTSRPVIPPVRPTTTPKPPAPKTTTPKPPPVAAATPPGAPGGVNADAADSSATVNWKAAAPNGAPVTAYHLSWPGGSTKVGGSTLSAKVPGLNNGTAYVITVVAENSAGRGPGASSGSIVPLRPAAAPKVTSTVGANLLSTVSWNQPDLGGGTLVHYQVSAPGQADRQVTALTAQYTDISGTVTVRAVTRFGPAGAPTVLGAPGSAKVYGKADLPTLTIIGAKTVSQGTVVLTVNAVSKNLPATCRVKSLLGSGFGDPVPCSGATELTIPGWWIWGSPIEFKATIENSVGKAEAKKTIAPGAESATGDKSGGAVLWLWPLAVLAAARKISPRWRRSGATRTVQSGRPD